MSHNVWIQMGIKKEVATEADQLLTQIFEQYFLAIERFLNCSLLEYDNLEDMVTQSVQREKQYRPIWKWLQEYGVQKIHDLARMPIPLRDEVLDYLDSELYTLETVIRDGVLEIVLPTLADTVSDLHRYVSTVNECSPSAESCYVTAGHPVLLNGKTFQKPYYSIASEPPADYQRVS